MLFYKTVISITLKTTYVYTNIYLRFLASVLSVLSSLSMLKYDLKIYKVVFSNTWRLAVKHKKILLKLKLYTRKLTF